MKLIQALRIMDERHEIKEATLSLLKALPGNEKCFVLGKNMISKIITGNRKKELIVNTYNSLHDKIHENIVLDNKPSLEDLRLLLATVYSNYYNNLKSCYGDTDEELKMPGFPSVKEISLLKDFLQEDMKIHYGYFNNVANIVDYIHIDFAEDGNDELCKKTDIKNIFSLIEKFHLYVDNNLTRFTIQEQKKYLEKFPSKYFRKYARFN